MESIGKVLEEPRYVVQNARSGFTKGVVGFGIYCNWLLGFSALTALRSGLRTVSQELCPIQVNGDMLECVDKFCYLGNTIGSKGGAEEASRMRVKCA